LGKEKHGPHPTKPKRKLGLGEKTGEVPCPVKTAKRKVPTTPRKFSPKGGGGGGSIKQKKKKIQTNVESKATKWTEITP